MNISVLCYVMCHHHYFRTRFEYIRLILVLLLALVDTKYVKNNENKQKWKYTTPNSKYIVYRHRYIFKTFTSNFSEISRDKRHGNQGLLIIQCILQLYGKTKRCKRKICSIEYLVLSHPFFWVYFDIGWLLLVGIDFWTFC